MIKNDLSVKYCMLNVIAKPWLNKVMAQTTNQEPYYEIINSYHTAVR